MLIQNKIITFPELEASYKKYITIPADLARIKKAYEFAYKKHEGQYRKSGDPYITHCVAVCYILSEMQTSPVTLMAALLHDTIEDTDTTKEEIEQNFGEEVAFLVEALTKITRLSDFHKSDFLAEDHRKIFIAMAQDIRVIVIKLADRLHNMRTMQFQPVEKQQRICKETMDVYVPIAHRLGLNSIMSEMEDLSLYYLDRPGYDKIESLLKESTKNLNFSLEKIKEKITKVLGPTRIPFEISSRVKSIYSIYKKMYIKNKKFEDIYDILALRIITKTETNCYEILGYIHTAFVPVPGRFKDYIAMPKPNMYQSLHTTILSGDGHVFEIQIRTKEMDETAEGGVAAHFRYKEGTKYDPKKEQHDIEERLHWFKDFVSLSDEGETSSSSASDYVNMLQQDIFHANVYVFTPKGKVIDLPKGATPIDFAYRIHTHIGDTISGAKVNGRLVPLATVLKTGDMVEVETSEKSSPSSTWLDSCVTNFAKSRIKKFLAKQNNTYVSKEQVEKGKQSLKDAFRERKINLQVEKVIDNKVLEAFKCKDFNDFYLKINSKNIVPSAVIDYLKIDPSSATLRAIETTNKVNAKNYLKKDETNSVLLSDGSPMMMKLATCCTPIPGDKIVGYITKGKGIKVHRIDCPNVKDDARKIDVIWNPNLPNSNKYPVDFTIESYDRPNLLIDISNVIASSGANMTSFNGKTNAKTLVCTFQITVQVKNVETLEKLFQAIKQIKSVYDVKRRIH